MHELYNSSRLSVIPLILFCSLRMIIIPLKLKSLQQGVNMQDISFSKLILSNKFASPVILTFIFTYYHFSLFQNSFVVFNIINYYS